MRGVIPSGPGAFLVFSFSSCFWIPAVVMSMSGMVGYVEVGGRRSGGIGVSLENTFLNCRFSALVLPAGWVTFTPSAFRCEILLESVLECFTKLQKRFIPAHSFEPSSPVKID